MSDEIMDVGPGSPLRPCAACSTSALDCFNGYLAGHARCCATCDHGVRLTDRGSGVAAALGEGFSWAQALTLNPELHPGDQS